MQILPTAAIENITKSRDSGRDNLGFSRLFSDYLDNNPAQISPVLDKSASIIDKTKNIINDNKALLLNSDSDMFSSKAPYIQSKNQGQFLELRFTPEEIRAIATGLQAKGLDSSIINAITSLADNPMGVTTPDILKSIASVVRNSAKIDDNDLDRIITLTRQIDPEGTLSENIMEDIQAGRSVSAWQNIVTALSNLSEDIRLDIDVQDIVSLGKALALSDNTIYALQKSFAKSSLKLAPQEFLHLMNPAQNELGERQTQLERLAENFAKVLSPVAQKARMRVASEEAAAGREERSVGQSKILIEDTVTKNSFVRNDNLDKQNQENTAGQNDNRPEDEKKSIYKQSGNEKNTGQNQDKNTVKAFEDGQIRQYNLAGDKQTVQDKTAPDAFSDSRQSGQDKFTGNGFGNRRETGSDIGRDNRKNYDAWESLLDKISYQENVSSASAGNQAQTSVQTSAQTARTLSNLPQYTAEVLDQVEQGILSANKDGLHRLELQLKPESLGAVTIVLTTKNGEISALLRAERPETANLISHQAEQMRFILEQQGLKVDKVEVQTQLQDHRGNMTWQGMEQHNASQERQAEAQDRERIMRLGKLHRDSSEDMNVDQNVHADNQRSLHQAEYAGHGLHLVA